MTEGRLGGRIGRVRMGTYAGLTGLLLDKCPTCANLSYFPAKVPASAALSAVAIDSAFSAVYALGISGGSEAAKVLPVFAGRVCIGIAIGGWCARILVPAAIGKACHYGIRVAAAALDNLTYLSACKPEAFHTSS
jgi:hypothetical protein